ncbi:hypothetical protein BpHYR1_037033 [Brachionus plicatilis]|uniref:Uncharacterized protein n=1 Tax=Brachionus plicatilis TaxID=10195 RepID=A0A3M7SMT5_BRAPC|nr:hypothetical protein BpHYR1_037033 [Brachionus plicatilis]
MIQIRRCEIHEKSKKNSFFKLLEFFYLNDLLYEQNVFVLAYINSAIFLGPTMNIESWEKKLFAFYGILGGPRSSDNNYEQFQVVKSSQHCCK